MRELHEETNIRSVERLGEIADWLQYDIPREIVGQAWKGKYRGQTQKWFAMRFTGSDSDIDVATDHPEFNAWKWAPPASLPQFIVPFKRQLYVQILAEFAPLLTPPSG